MKKLIFVVFFTILSSIVFSQKIHSVTMGGGVSINFVDPITLKTSAPTYGLNGSLSINYIYADFTVGSHTTSENIVYNNFSIFNVGIIVPLTKNFTLIPTFGVACINYYEKFDYNYGLIGNIKLTNVTDLYIGVGLQEQIKIGLSFHLFNNYCYYRYENENF